MSSPPLVVALPDSLTPTMAFERISKLPFPVLLEGAADRSALGRWSYLAADPIDRMIVSADQWPQLADRLRSTAIATNTPNLPPFAGGWLGWLGYELGVAFDRQPIAPRDQFSSNDGELQLHDWIIAWDHANGSCWLISTGIDRDGVADDGRAKCRADEVLRLLESGAANRPVPGLASARLISRSIEESAYCRAVESIRACIAAGDIFQANLSQRFVVATSAAPFDIYLRLRHLTGASHAALLVGQHGTVVSASPEQFLRYDAGTGTVASRPIKGTAPRSGDPVADAAHAAALQASAKDRAENVMIVDLARNDLNRVCDAGSVSVPELCALDSHPTVHHLRSTVTGKLRSECDALDLLAAAFPAGSITGAPKLRAIEILAELEPVARGAYCGAIGWFGLDGSIGLSVAIRTMMIRDGAAAVHAGGGVTLLSDPAAEYAESMAKAAAMLASLGVRR